MRFHFCLFIVLLFALVAGTARADDYETPTWPNLVRTLVRFNAIPLSDPAILDEYTIITDCQLYKSFYENDFKWHQVREAVLASIKQNIATFPMNYHYDTKLQLDRYDFKSQIFRFTEKSSIHNVNSFAIYSVAGTSCGQANVKFLPRDFRAVISDPIYMDGIPLVEKDAQGLLEQMTRDGNADRIVYARFNLRIVYIDPLRAGRTDANADPHYQQSNALLQNFVRLDARLSSIDFYEDPAMQVLIYQFQL